MPAFLVAGEVHTAASPTLDATASACLRGLCAAPIKLSVPYLQGQITLPYFAAGIVTEADETMLRLARAALAQAGISTSAELQATALLLGTSSGDVGLHEQLYREELSTEACGGAKAIPVREASYGCAAQRLAVTLGIAGPCYTLTTACSAAANALLLATQLIEAGRVRHALVLGTETKNLVSLLGFHGLMLTAKNGYKPFDAQRDGIVLGEALGAAVLSTEPRGASAWQILGGASLCDSAHPTSSSPQGIAGVIAAALANAGVSASQIVAIKAHGTGTPSNDEAEAKGLMQVFATAMPPFTSLKSSLGHTLGACGVVETLTLLRAIECGGLPATAGFAEADPALGGMVPVQHCTPLPRGPVLLNYFGFGGNNCALVFAPC